MTPDAGSKKVLLTTSYYKPSPGGGKKRKKCVHTCKRKNKRKRVSMKMN